jgi:hypothetical protein
VHEFFHLQLRRWRLEIIQYCNASHMPRCGLLNFLFRAS